MKTTPVQPVIAAALGIAIAGAVIWALGDCEPASEPVPVCEPERQPTQVINLDGTPFVPDLVK